MQLRDVPEWAAVRIKGGRIGTYTKRGPGNKPTVAFADRSGLRVSLSDEAEVIAYPARLAYEYVETLTAAGLAGDHG